MFTLFVCLDFFRPFHSLRVSSSLYFIDIFTYTCIIYSNISKIFAYNRVRDNYNIFYKMGWQFLI